MLDNFETNLRSIEEPNGYACSDPAWDRLFAALSVRIGESGSRVLISTRHRLAALAGVRDAQWVPLGPLPIADAVLFFEGCPPLRELLYGDDLDEQLVQRILDVTRGHPLILQLLADLASVHYSPIDGLKASGRDALQDALTRIRSEEYATLPDLFMGARTEVEKDHVRRYLDDVAIGAVDLLLERLSSEARSLLWEITRAGEPVSEQLLSDLWSGVSIEEDIVRTIVARLQEEILPHQRAELEAKFAELHKHAEFRVHIDALREPSREHAERPQIAPLLEELVKAGLIHRQATPGGLVEYTFHELVAERTQIWAKTHSETFIARTEEQISKAYGDWYAMMFEGLMQSGVPSARDAAAEFGARSIRYLVRAGAFKRLGEFASRMVADISDSPRHLGQVIADLQSAVEKAPAGKLRFRLQGSLADAYRVGNQVEDALQLYEQVAEEAEKDAEWDLLGWIYSQWAGALVLSGHHERARSLFERSVEFRRRAGRPRADLLAVELEMLRIDIFSGNAEVVFPEVIARIDELRFWWHRLRRDETVTEISDREPDRVVNAFISALDIGCHLGASLERWQLCDELWREMMTVELSRGAGEYALAELRMKHCATLTKLGRFNEAKASLEECLEVFRAAGSVVNQAQCLDSLAHVWDDMGDPRQALLMRRTALHIWNGLSLIMQRAASHHNISLYLHDIGEVAEAGFHWLAGFLYCDATGFDKRHSIGGLQRHLRRSISGGYEFPLPRIAEVLASPEFASLREFVVAQGLSDERLKGLQEEVDYMVPRHKAAVSAVVPVTLAPEALCVCGSGLPFQKCHGADAE